MTRTGSKTIIAELTRTKADVEALLHKEIAKNSQLEAELATAYRQAELDIGVGRLQAKALAAAHAERDAAQAAFERAAIAEGEAIVARDAAQARVDKAQSELAEARRQVENEQARACVAEGEVARLGHELEALAARVTLWRELENLSRRYGAPGSNGIETSRGNEVLRALAALDNQVSE